MQHTMMPFPLTLPALLSRGATLFPTVPVVSRRPDRSLHRTDLGTVARRARALASALRRAGLRPGDRVGTLMWNHHAHLEAYFGIPCAGGVLHTLNLRLHSDDLAWIVRHAGDRFVVVDDVLLPLWEKVAPQVDVERVVVVRWDGSGADDDYEALLATGDPDEPLPELEEEAPLGLCYTSGTTGRPKGVVYSHRSTVLHSLALGLVDGLGLSHGNVLLPVVPMFHVNAWGLPFAAMMLGTALAMPGPHLDAVSVLDLMASEGVDFAAGVPTVWLAVLAALDAEPDRWDLRPDTRMLVGGAAAPESLIRGLGRHGLRLVHAWGMTEMSPVGTVGHVKRHLADADEDALVALRCKQGIPVPLVEIRAVAEDRVVPWDGETQGELQVRGPWVAGAYHRPDAGDAAADRWTDDGWFRTGDVVTIDAEGYVRITDRAKDLVKSGGEWISSVDLENALMGHPAVAEAAVIAVPHPKWLERPLACVVLEPGATVTADDLAAWLAPRFARWWLPDDYVFLDAIPRTSTGKFLKAALRDRFRAHVLPTVG